ncbi:MAG: hypothetical protein FJ381_02085 [Verrucomicrobia bacterium]|nr:hypothetical protein [Verrucomicrobiota bacterium]
MGGAEVEEAEHIRGLAGGDLRVGLAAHHGKRFAERIGGERGAEDGSTGAPEGGGGGGGGARGGGEGKAGGGGAEEVAAGQGGHRGKSIRRAGAGNGFPGGLSR